MMKDRFVPLKILHEVYPHFPFRRSTLYKWSCLGKNPALFRKVGGTVLVDMSEFERMCAGEKG